ncbi:hypothetical protein [Dyella sp.]|uniref:hypothetical protein n=1 Tax=Dyella sp. TaxID=1869338 RepID=UPI002ED07759
MSLGGLSASPAQAQDQALHYLGTAYASDTGAMVYREEHWVYLERGAWRRLVLYRCPSGQPFARKRIDDALSNDPDFDYLDGRDGYQEGVRQESGRRQVFVRKSGDDPQTLRPLTLPAAPAVIDAGFDSYVRQHWNSLNQGAGTSVAFLVPSRGRFMNLRIDHATPVQVDGAPATRLRLSLDAWYGFAAPSITLTYLDNGRRLRRFEGISNVHDAHGRTQTVRIEFPADDALGPAGPGDIEAALRAPLASHCSP